MEIVNDHAMAMEIPIVNVTNPLAKVTHEAAIGRVIKDRWKHLWRVLNTRRSNDLIVKGILR